MKGMALTPPTSFSCGMYCINRSKITSRRACSFALFSVSGSCSGSGSKPSGSWVYKSTHRNTLKHSYDT